MANEGGFETTAKRSTVDRGNDRLGRGFDGVQHGIEIRALRRLAKFGDVGTGDEGLPFAADDDRLDAIVLQPLFDAV